MSVNARESGPAGVVIRGARADELRPVLALLESEQLPTAGVAEAFGGFIVAELEGRLVGAAGLEVYAREGVLRSLVVSPELRGRGVGRRLAERVVESARLAGLRRLYLLTTTAESYFSRLGFRPVERSGVTGPVLASVEFGDACPASAAVMVRELGVPAEPVV